MLDTDTRFKSAISASRNASSKLVRYSLCIPLPFVRNIILGTYSIGSDNEVSNGEDEGWVRVEVEDEVEDEGWVRVEVEVEDVDCVDDAIVLDLLLLLLLFFEFSMVVTHILVSA
jgi:hypothetical protein